MRALNIFPEVAVPYFSRRSIIVIKQLRSCRRARTHIPCAVDSDNSLPGDRFKDTHIGEIKLNQQATPKIEMSPPIPPDTAAGAPIERALPSGLWEMELLLGKGEGKDISTSTIERWTAAYQQMVRDAQDLGIPASVIPKLPANPTKEELRQARDHLDRMVQSFLSAGL